LRDRYDAIRQRGGEVVAIGTGNASLARSFAEDYAIPFPVLLDETGEAARAASVARVGFLRLFHPASYAGARRAWRAGHRVALSGKRVDQLGATFVLGAGGRLRYAHRDAHTADHAPMEAVLAALEEAA
jgi:peroxiredoxin